MPYPKAGPLQRWIRPRDGLSQETVAACGVSLAGASLLGHRAARRIRRGNPPCSPCRSGGAVACGMPLELAREASLPKVFGPGARRHHPRAVSFITLCCSFLPVDHPRAVSLITLCCSFLLVDHPRVSFIALCRSFLPVDHPRAVRRGEQTTAGIWVGGELQERLPAGPRVCRV